MNDINQVSFTGRLTRAPELRVLASGNSVVEFTLAIHRKYNDREDTVFMPVEAWGKLAEIVNSVASQGSTVLVTGRMKQDNWTADDGSNRSKLIMVADEFLHIRKPRDREEV